MEVVGPAPVNFPSHMQICLKNVRQPVFVCCGVNCFCCKHTVGCLIQTGSTAGNGALENRIELTRYMIFFFF